MGWYQEMKGDQPSTSSNLLWEGQGYEGRQPGRIVIGNGESTSRILKGVSSVGCGAEVSRGIKKKGLTFPHPTPASLVND
jgi:hypothetical protein